MFTNLLRRCITKHLPHKVNRCPHLLQPLVAVATGYLCSHRSCLIQILLNLCISSPCHGCAAPQHNLLKPHFSGLLQFRPAQIGRVQWSAFLVAGPSSTWWATPDLVTHEYRTHSDEWRRRRRNGVRYAKQQFLPPPLAMLVSRFEVLDVYPKQTNGALSTSRSFGWL